jgi:hypothetical protein
MRRTSRREDAADWVIKVSPNFKFAKIAKGMAFTTTFIKNKEDNGEHEESMDCTFVTENGRTNVSWMPTDLETLVYELIKSSVDRNADIAEEFGTSKALVSRDAKRLINDNFIKKEGQRYVLSSDQYLSKKLGSWSKRIGFDGLFRRTFTRFALKGGFWKRFI